jgi:hypothetical protein
MARFSYRSDGYSVSESLAQGTLGEGRQFVVHCSVLSQQATGARPDGVAAV